MTTRTRRPCRQRRSHHDAIRLIDWLLAHGNKTDKTNAQIAAELGFYISRGGGIQQIDKDRLRFAREHVSDSIIRGGTAPCTGYRLHYRTSSGHPELCLIDPADLTGIYSTAALETVRGWLLREKVHQSENLRQQESFEALADEAIAHADRVGARIITKAQVDLDRQGTVAPATIAELEAWVASL